MERKYVKSFKCYFLSLLTLTTMGLTKLAPVKAEEIELNNEPAITGVQKEEYNLDKKYLLKNHNWQRIILELFRKNPAVHIMENGENLGAISKNVVCEQLGVEKTRKYWVVEAYLSGYPKIGKPGDEVYYINSAEDMEIALTILKTVGWYANYVQNNGTYKPDSVEGFMTVSELVYDIYKIDDPELVIRFLAEKNLLCEYDGNTVVRGELVVKLTESIPSLEDLGYNVPQK
jgi:hypothetical protein